MNLHRSLPPLLLALGLSGCATTSRKTDTTTRVEQPATPLPPAAQVTVRDEGNRTPSNETLAAGPIYFTLDSATLTPEAQDGLERLAQALRQRPQARVTVSGHTCELGTTEYNLALGQHRADIVRTYLVRLGVEPQHIQVVSYGEERPADEHALEKNRRAEFSFRQAE